MIRILHRHDLSRKTRIMEERLDGDGPWYLVEDGYESPEAGYVTGDTGKKGEGKVMICKGRYCCVLCQGGGNRVRIRSRYRPGRILMLQGAQYLFFGTGVGWGGWPRGRCFAKTAKCWRRRL